MKKTLLTAAAVALFGLPVIASAQGKMVFALVPKNMNNPFFDQARDGCKKAEKESGGKIECRYIGPGEHGGGDEQVKVVQDLITAKVNGIAVSPSNAPAMAIVLERAKAAGIPVTTWDSDLLPKDKGLRATYVGTKNYDIGVNLAKIVMKLKPKGGTICIQSGGAAAANHNERMQGIRDTISGKKSKEPPGDRLTGQNGWKEVEGLYANDETPLRDTDERNLAKYPGPDASCRPADSRSSYPMHTSRWSRRTWIASRAARRSWWLPTLCRCRWISLSRAIAVARLASGPSIWVTSRCSSCRIW
jgi:ribose transport system substrate-binding protein